MIRREIAGPQAAHERSGDQTLRDVRPLTVRLSYWLRGQASGLVLGGMAGATLLAPALVDLTVVSGTFYAVWVLTRRIEMPIRLPRSARRRDRSDPDPATRKPRMAAGDDFLGWEEGTGKEIWLSNEDVRQHGTSPGTTGSGKTTTILSSYVNPLSQGSGVCLVDGKANAELYGQVYVLTRRFGRDDDMRVLNLLTASLPAEATAHGYNPHSQTNSYNPFASGNADALQELVASQLGEAPANDANGVFRGRAVALIGTLTPVLVWMRDHKGIPIDIEKIRYMVELRSIWTLAKQKVFLIRNLDGGEPKRFEVPDIPEALVYPLLAYLGEIPGYNMELPYNQQTSEKPSEQHGYAIFYFTQTFTQLAVSLGHIFKVQTGDIDMRDVVMNRRILIVNLPALEKNDDNLAALGRIVVASLRGMMAQLLGAKLEGDPHEIFAYKPGMGVGTFRVDFDELAYYATAGMDRMLAMGRGINIGFRIAFQELGGIWARLGEKTYSLLGNANLTVGMRQQDSGRTREWLEKTAGQAWVTHATSYQGALEGASYREAQNADVRQVNRVDWQDYQNLLPGEAVVLLGGRRVYAKLFHVQLDITGRPRLNRPLMLPAPDAAAVRGPAGRAAAVRDRIEDGLLSGDREPPLDKVLDTMASTLAAIAAAGGTAEDCVAAAVDAAGPASKTAAQLAAIPNLRLIASDDGAAASDGSEEGEDDNERDEDDHGTPAGPPITEFSGMLGLTAEAPVVEAGPPGKPHEPVDAKLLAALTSIEVAAGLSKPAARAAAAAAVGDRDVALAAIVLPSKLPMTEVERQERLDRLLAQLAALGPVAQAEKAAADLDGSDIT